MHVELTILGAHSRGKFELHDNESVVLGRGGTIRLDNDILVSRNHARISLAAGKITITDLGSRNGTFLGGTRLPAHQAFEMEAGDEAEISLYRIIIRVIGAEDDLHKTQPIHFLPPAEFKVIAEIGSGGMGQVWRVEQTLLGVQRAIKVLHPSLMADPVERKRFLREAKIAASISCPNLVTVHDARLLQGRVYLVMEYVNGPSLHQLRQRQPLTTLQTLRITRGVTVALQELLTHGIMHRDVKPGNILLDPDADGTAKLTDYGLARPFLSDATIDIPRGEGLGSLAFVAPEQAIDAERVDERADIFGLGATMYYMLSGRPPREIKSRDIDEILDLLDKDPPPLNLVAKDCPTKLAALVMRMLSQNPDHRPRGPGVVLMALDQLIQEEQAALARTPESGVYKRPPDRP